MSGDKLIYSVAILFIYLTVVSGYTALAGYSNDVFLPEFDRGDVVSVNVSGAGNISELPILYMSGSWDMVAGKLRCKSVDGGMVIFDYSRMSDPEVNLSLVGISADYRVYVAKSSDILSNSFIVADWNESAEFFRVWSYDETKILKRISNVREIATLNIPASAARTVMFGFRSADGQSWLDRILQNMVIIEFWVDEKTYGGVYEVEFKSGGLLYPGVACTNTLFGVSFISYVERMEYSSTSDVLALIPQMLKVLVFNPPDMAMPSVLHWLLFKLPFILFVVLFGLIIGGVSPL